MRDIYDRMLDAALSIRAPRNQYGVIEIATDWLHFFISPPNGTFGLRIYRQRAGNVIWCLLWVMRDNRGAWFIRIGNRTLISRNA